MVNPSSNGIYMNISNLREDVVKGSSLGGIITSQTE
jgi:hypothetical protein